MKLKHIYPNILTICLLGIMVCFCSCDKGFEEMNQNPNAFTSPVVENLFSSAIQKHAAGNGQITDPELTEAGSWVQYLASLELALFYGDKYLWREGYYERFWTSVYSTELKEPVQIIELTKEDPEQINLHAIARIWKVEVFHRLTDMYGDAPYFDAGQGYIGSNYKPKFDRQSAIYADMLQELDEAAQALDSSKPSYGAADFLYGGDVTRWKRFAYSLMLRLGMRLTKVDIAAAEEWVKKAIAGGVMQSNEDIARLEHTAGSSFNWNVGNNIIINQFVPVSSRGRTMVKLNETFVDHLKATEDPRLPFYGTLWQGNANISELASSSEPARQRGLPGGQDATSIRTVIPGWTDDMRAEFTEWNIQKVAHLEAPTVFQNYSEVEYLLAEATLRGWIAEETVQAHYNKGVLASIQLQTIYPNAISIEEASAAANLYLEKNPFLATSFEEQMEQIHIQFWVSQFMCSNVESYSNWRRTGYPQLTPYNYPGNETGGSIPRRVRYAAREASLNTEHYNEAVALQGPDLFTTRIWWDVE